MRRSLAPSAKRQRIGEGGSSAASNQQQTTGSSQYVESARHSYHGCLGNRSTWTTATKAAGSSGGANRSGSSPSDGSTITTLQMPKYKVRMGLMLVMSSRMQL